jgi:putative ATPase
MNLFSEPPQSTARPLADRLRPRGIDEFFGQLHLLATGTPLRQAVDGASLHSMILWGPPGSGKTTLARLLAARASAHFIAISAVFSGVKDIREAVDQARQWRAEGKSTVLFVDEVHRFNKSQQDGFLPYVEDGTLTFIGATTENPSFELNNALLSRARIYVLKALAEEDIRRIVLRAVSDQEAGLGARHLAVSDEALEVLVRAADGDARRALNLLEIAADLIPPNPGAASIDVELVRRVAGEGVRRFDKGGDSFYEQISALHKSVRGSNPDAALYWYARMIDGGCDPLYIARRVVRMASEDVGNADPRALSLTLDAWDTQERLGSPEGELAVAQAIVYLACAPKSNAVYAAYGAAMEDVRRHGSLEVPLHLRNASTGLARQLGYGRDYRYAHDEPDGYAAGERYFPDELLPQIYYQPVERGLEQKIAERLRELRRRDSERQSQATDATVDEESKS